MPPPFGPVIMCQNLTFSLSQTNNGCSLLSLILDKLLRLDIPVSCENIFALSIVTVLTACPFSIKKDAKISVFYVKIVKIYWPLLPYGG